nr:ankyrin repeat-containing protein BDA1-like [Ipomoea batatas]
MSSPFQSHWDVLTTAAKENEVTALYKSIQDDPEILNKINDIPFVDTPLHVAAANGNTLFAVETMAIMPSFCKKLNGEGLSPLHAALQNGRLETARHMVKLESGLVRVGGRGKMTPMHYLVSVTKNDDAEKLEVLIDFLTACPEAVKDVTVECKTPMHVAIDSRSFEAFGVMFGWLWRTGKINLLYMEDINGNSALRLAAEAEQTIKYTQQASVECPKIIRKAFKRIRENSKEIIANAKAKEGLNRLKFFLSPETPMQKLIRYSAHVHKGMSMEIRNVVLVVAVLVATAVYQASLTPPNAVLHTKDPTSSNIMLTPSPITKNVHYKHHFTLGDAIRAPLCSLQRFPSLGSVFHVRQLPHHVARDRRGGAQDLGLGVNVYFFGAVWRYLLCTLVYCLLKDGLMDSVVDREALSYDVQAYWVYGEGHAN